jgi:hypothetical protein
MTTAQLALTSVLAIALLPACSRPKAPERSPNGLVITVDTLRADRLGCYGFDAARTANIDKLSREGIRVEHAVASAPITAGTVWPRVWTDTTTSFGTRQSQHRTTVKSRS